MADIEIKDLPLKEGDILDNAILHISESSADKRITIAQLLNKNAQQYSSDINMFLSAADKSAARANLDIERHVTVDNTNYNILNTDKVIIQIGTLTAVRIFTLPLASTVIGGSVITILDQSGSVNMTEKLIAQRSGADTIDNNLTQYELLTPFSSVSLLCDGVNRWSVVSPTGYKFAGAPGLKVYRLNATWVKPNGVKGILVEVIGAGGGGAGATPSSNGGGGGGGGYSKSFIDASNLPNTVEITIGVGGAGGASGFNGNAGGTSHFGGYIYASGGGGGAAGGAYGGEGGVGSGGALNLRGNQGAGDVFNGTGTGDIGSIGGASFFGGSGAASNNPPSVGGNGVDGGGGGSGYNGSVGGAGGDGIVVIHEYY